MKLILGFFFISLSAWGVNHQLPLVLDLTIDTSDILLHSAEGRPILDGDFRLKDNNTTDLMLELGQLHEQIREIEAERKIESDCDPEEVEEIDIQNSKMDFQIYLTYETDNLFNDSKKSQRFFVKDRYEYALSDYYNANTESLTEDERYRISQIGSYERLRELYVQKNPGINLDDLAISEIDQRLRDFAKNHANIEVSQRSLYSNIAFEKLVRGSATAKTDEELLAPLAEIKNDLSFEEKYDLVAHAGAHFNEVYSYDRLNEIGDAGRGKVSVLEMFSSVRTGDAAGVCRDNAVAQTRMLEELGIDSIVVGYKTATNAHATVLAVNPDNNQEVVKIDWRYVNRESDRAGADALVQASGAPDVGLKYNLYDSRGNPIQSVSTEQGKIIRSALNTRSANRFERPVQINKAQLDLGRLSGNITTGTTTRGTDVVAFAGNITALEGNNGRLKLGAAYQQISGEMIW